MSSSSAAGLDPDHLELTIGRRPLRFEGRSVDGILPHDPIQGLQNAMRDAEARLAERTLAAGAVDLVVSDGPLTYFATGPAVGMVKRQARSYLDPPRARVLADLLVGDRSPIFKLGEQRLERYSWYVRLGERRAIDGSMAGIVRLEVASQRWPRLGAGARRADRRHPAALRAGPRPRSARAAESLSPSARSRACCVIASAIRLLVRRALEVRIQSEVLRGS